MPTGIEPFIHRKVVVLFESDPAETAARAMEAHGIGSVLVSDDHGHLSGIVTDRDLACRALAHGQAGLVPLREVMTRNPLTVKEDASLESVIELMETHGVRRVPVIRELPSGKTHGAGMVSLDDLVASGQISGLHLMRVVRAQLLRRMIGSAEYRHWLESLETGGGRGGRDEGTSEELYQTVAHATELPLEDAETLTRLVILTLARRLHRTAAASLARELPEDLRREIAELPASIDHSAGVQSLVPEVMQTLNRSMFDAQALIYRASRVLVAWIGWERFHHIRDQLPYDLKMLFGARRPLGGAAA